MVYTLTKSISFCTSSFLGLRQRHALLANVSPQFDRPITRWYTDGLQTYYIYQFLYELLFGFETETRFVGGRFSPVWPAHDDTKHWWSTDLPCLPVSVLAPVRVWDRDTICWRTFLPSLTSPWRHKTLMVYRLTMSTSFCTSSCSGLRQRHALLENISPQFDQRITIQNTMSYRLTTSISFCTSSCSGLRQRHALLANASPQFDNMEHRWCTDLPLLLASVRAPVRVWDTDTLCWQMFPPSLTSPLRHGTHFLSDGGDEL